MSTTAESSPQQEVTRIDIVFGPFKRLNGRLRKVLLSQPSDSISRRPSVPLSTFVHGTGLTKLLAIFDQAINEIKES
jgi:hypothetical protein